MRVLRNHYLDRETLLKMYDILKGEMPCMQN